MILLAISNVSSGFLFGLFGPKSVCCKDTGCFTKDAPFTLMPLPDCAENYGIKYTMYTRNNKKNGEVFTKSTSPSVFRGERRTVFVIHGFLENQDYTWMTTIKDAFIEREDIQVVIVDWSKGGSNPNYFQSASNTRTAGAYTAVVIQNLLRQPSANASKFWCVGHSLGSHVCGHTGMSMPSDQQLGRITGLDPAGPAFETNKDVKIGINPSSAKFVDIMHTSIILGTERKLGHIDFYVVGHQLAGLDLSFKSAFELGIICGPLCAHKRSVDFMIASLRGTDNCFSADRQCTSEYNLLGSCTVDDKCVAYMGYRADHGCKTTGIFLVKVPPEAPFCTQR